MSGRDLYEAIAAGQPGGDEDAAWLAALAEAGRGWRGWLAGSLAQAELEEGLRWDEQEARAAAAAPPAASLAADDAGGLRFPARYAVGPWRLLIGLDAAGEAYALLEDGPGPATLTLEGLEVALEPGREVPLPGLYEPPPRAALVGPDGLLWTLSLRP